MKQSHQITQLLEACKRHDAKAQIEIYNRYYKAMYNTALRIVHNPDDAEDVMQEAFIKAFDKLNTLKNNTTFGAWLKRIVVNESILFLRQKKTHLGLDEHINRIETTETETPIDTTTWQIKQLMEAIGELKDNYRIIINLYYIEGYDYEEIMQILNLSYANVRTLISRAKHKLKEKMNQKLTNNNNTDLKIK